MKLNIIKNKKGMEAETVLKIIIGLAILLTVLVLIAKFGGFLNGEGSSSLSNLFRFG